MPFFMPTGRFIAMPEETQPPKRGPGRPRKIPATKPLVVDTPDAWKTEDSPTVSQVDERIGQSVGDVRATGISFPDGTEYRCVAGIITERIR